MEEAILEIIYAAFVGTSGLNICRLDPKAHFCIDILGIIAGSLGMVHLTGNFSDALRLQIKLVLMKLMSRLAVLLICLDYLLNHSECERAYNALMVAIAISVIFMTLNIFVEGIDDHPIALVISNIAQLFSTLVLGHFSFNDQDTPLLMPITISCAVSTYGPVILEILGLYNFEYFLMLAAQMVMLVCSGMSAEYSGKVAEGAE